MVKWLILVVDEEPNTVELTRIYWERDGYQVETASERKMALVTIDKINPSLVVLDIMLPNWVVNLLSNYLN